MHIEAGNGKAELITGLSIIHSNHLEDLRQVAVRWIGSHPLKPLENEIFLVQSNGMAQWLKLSMAADEGCWISSAVDFQLPARFLWNAYRAVLGEAETPYESAYDKEQLILQNFYFPLAAVGQLKADGPVVRCDRQFCLVCGR